MEEESVTEQKNRVFAGSLEKLPPPTSKVVRIFTSSTFTDTTIERNALMEEVYPRIKDYCREEHGLDFQVVDMRWGVRDEATDDHMTTQLCMNEIYNCQRLSMGPNFVVFLCQKYGYRPIPTIILASELDMLKQAMRDAKDDVTPYETWYRLDANAVPPVYVLQPISSILVNFNNKRMQKLQEQDSATWWETMGVMQRGLRKAAKICHDAGKLSQDGMHNYYMSVTEREVINGVLNPKHTRDHCLCYIRHINDINLNNLRAAGKFVDIVGGQIDTEATKLLSNLRDERVPAKLESTNIARFSIDWMGREGMDAVSHGPYLKKFCDHFYKGITSLVDRAMRKHAKFKDKVYTEVLQHLHACFSVCSVFHGRESELDVLRKYITGPSILPLIIYGESGCGKTSVLAKAASMVTRWRSLDATVVLRFLGTSPDSSSISPLLISLSEQIAYNYDQARETYPSELSQLFTHFKKMMACADKDRPLVILLDSLDLLSPQDGAHELLWFPPTLPVGVKLIVSTTPANSHIFETLQRIVDTEQQYLQVLPLGVDLANQVISEWLKSANRTLTQRQFEIVKRALNKCNLPIFVKLVFATVSQWKSYSRVQDTILANSVNDSIQSLFDRTEAKHGKLLVSHALSYITAAKSGISESELEDLISLDDKVLDDIYQYHLPPVRRIPPLLWTRIRADLPGYLSERDADEVIVLNWYHNQFDDAAVERYFKNLNHLHFVHSSIADYFLGIWANVPKPFQFTEIQRQRFGITEREGLADRKVPAQPNMFTAKDGTSLRYNLRKLSELPFHLARAERFEELYSKTLFNFDFLQSKVSSFPLQALMNDFDDACQHIRDKEVKKEFVLLADALRLSGSILSKHPYMLPFELVGRLLPLIASNPHVRSLVIQADIDGSKQNALLPTHHCFHSPGGPLKYSLEDHPFAVFGVALTSDRKLLVSVSNRFIVWDMGTGEMARHVNPKIEGIMFGLSLSSDDRWIATYTNNCELLLMSMLTGEVTRFKEPSLNEQMAIKGIAVTPTHLMFWTKTAHFIYTIDGHFVGRSDVKSCEIVAVQFYGPEDFYVVTWSGMEDDLALRLDCMVQGKQWATLQFRAAMVLTKNRKRIYACTISDSVIGMYNAKDTNWKNTENFELEAPEEQERVISMRLSDTEHYLAAVVSYGYNLWHVDSRKLIQLKLPQGVRNIPLKPMHSTTPTTFTANHEFFAAGVRKNLYIWSLERAQLVQTLDAHFARILGLLTLSENGQNCIVSSSLDHTVKVWNMNNVFEKVYSIERLEKSIDAIQIASKESRFCVTLTRKYAAVWNINTHRLVATLADSTHSAVVTHALIVPDASHVFTVESGEVLCWNVEKEQVVHRVKQDTVYQLALIEKDNVLLVVSKDERTNTAIIVARKTNDLQEVYRQHFEYRKFNDVLVMKNELFMVAMVSVKGKDHLQPIHCKTGTPMYKIKIGPKCESYSKMKAMPHNSNMVVLIDTDKCWLWDIKNKRLLRKVQRWNGACTSDGKLGLYAPMRGGLEMIELKKGYTVRTLISRVIEGVNEVRAEYSRSNRHILYYHAGHSTLKVFRAKDGKQIACLKPHAQLTTFITTPDGQKVVLGAVDGSLLVAAIVDPDEESALEFLAKQPSRKALAQHLGVENTEPDDVTSFAGMKSVVKAANKFRALIRHNDHIMAPQTSSTCALQ